MSANALYIPFGDSVVRPKKTDGEMDWEFWVQDASQFDRFVQADIIGV